MELTPETVSLIISVGAMLIAVIGWIFEANQRRELQRWVRKSMIIGSRLKVVDDYVIEAGKLAERYQEILLLKLQWKKLGFLRRAANEMRQSWVWVAVQRHRRTVNNMELDVSDILEMIDDPDLNERKLKLQAAYKELARIVDQVQDPSQDRVAIDASIAHAQEVLGNIKQKRVAFRKAIDQTLLKQ